MTRLLLSVGAALLLTVGTVWAGPLEDATAAYKRGDYATVFKILEPLATQGNAGAQYRLGALYELGHGVRQDYVTAREWYEKAAAQGNAGAQYNLGGLYAHGQGVPQDYAKASQWWEQAAAQNDTWAQYNLGTVYFQGQGVPKDYVRAYMWLNLAAAHLTGDEQKSATNNRDKAASLLTPAQIAEAQRLAQQCQAQQSKGC